MPSVTLSLDPRDNESILIASPYEAKDVIKSFPQRRWNPIKKVWIIPIHHESMAKERLTDAGFRVSGLTQVERDLLNAERRIIVLEKKLNEASRTQSYYRPRNGDAFVELDRMLPSNLRGPVYKALMRIFHPDMGGTTELAQKLNGSPLAKERSRA